MKPSAFSGLSLFTTSSPGASYTQLLPYDITAGLSASYYHLDKSDALNGLNAGDRWQADVSLSTRLMPDLSGSLSLGYGRDQTAGNLRAAVL